MNSLWIRLARTVVAIAAFGFAPFALLFGVVWGLAVSLVALLGVLIWNLVYFDRLLTWLEGPHDRPLPHGSGTWEVVFAGLYRRVRSRQRQQRSLSEMLERFRSAFQAFPDGVIGYDSHRRIEWLNPQAEAHFALSASVDSGQALTNLIRHPDFVTYLDKGEYDEPLIYRGGRIEGLTLLLQVIRYGDEQNLLISRDISQLERAEIMRRDFIANVSHELKTPLTVVAGFTELIADGEAERPDSPIAGYLRLITEQTARMQRLIQDLLTLSALENDAQAVFDETVDMGILLPSLLSEAKALSAGRHEVTLHLDSSARLRGSLNELHSAFANLAANAVRYTPAGGHVELIWRDGVDGVEFVVSDDGIGIAPQHLPRLTERFYRVDRSRSRETGGTGLGLAIVKHVLIRHHGALDISSEPGQGSRFTARFPKAAIALPPAVITPTESQASS